MKKRRILLALIMLIISGISLTTATYAWFTANRAVNVQEIDVKAQASGGIQISADAETWSNEVKIDDLLAEGLVDKGIHNYIPDTALKPVTTIGVNGKKGAFDFYLGELNDAGDKVTLTSIEDNSGNYVAFDLYFYSAKPQAIEFNEGTQVVAKNVDTPLSAAKDTGLKSSVRVGFLVQGNDPTATPVTSRNLAEGLVANQTIWEPNANIHTDYAKNMLGANGIMTTMGGKAITPLGAEDKPTYVATNNSTYFENITAETHHLKTSDEGDKYPSGTIFNFAAGITKVRVYVWLEGQDIDNEDTASLGTGVGVLLKFKIAGSSGA
ncbi:MAG: hypothetical protein MR765_07570 [Tenericutes bacterium]|nr:hypothetical protein [Mycoplasmatota bacterium]